MLKTLDLGSFLFFTSVSFLINFCFTDVPVIEAAFSPASATWYGDPTGAGSIGGACGYRDDVEKPPLSAMVSAGNANLFRQGKGCGACYQVKCTENAACSGDPVTVTIMDGCPGVCNTNAAPIHFDLSGTAFGAMAKSGQAELLRSAGILHIEYRRVACNYPKTNVVFTVDAGSNPSYFACVVEYVKGDEDLSAVDLQVSGDFSDKYWLPMQQFWGASWIIYLPMGATAPFSIMLTLEFNKNIVTNNVIPADWAPGKSYSSLVNFD